MTDDALRSLASLPGIRLTMSQFGTKWCVGMAWNDGPPAGVTVSCADPVEAMSVAASRAATWAPKISAVPDDLADLLG